jgi:hypothetical protein
LRYCGAVLEKLLLDLSGFLRFSQLSLEVVTQMLFGVPGGIAKRAFRFVYEFEALFDK